MDTDEEITWHVRTVIYNRARRLLGSGVIHVQAKTAAEAETAAIQFERDSWGSPRLMVECHVEVEPELARTLQSLHHKCVENGY